LAGRRTTPARASLRAGERPAAPAFCDSELTQTLSGQRAAAISIPLHHLPLLPSSDLSRIEVRLYHHLFSCCIFSRITQLHNHYLNVSFGSARRAALNPEHDVH
jgi:hypothetical protein